MKTWKLALIVGGLAAAAVFGAAAVAFGGGVERALPFMGQGGGMVFTAGESGASEDPVRGCGRSGLLQDPQAREDMLELRDEHRAEMSAWWDEYGDDPRSEEAQKALTELREEHRSDMLGLFEKYGVTPPAGFGEGGRGGCLGGASEGGGCGGRGSGGQGFGAGQGFGGQGMMGGQGWSGDTL